MPIQRDMSSFPTKRPKKIHSKYATTTCGAQVTMNCTIHAAQEPPEKLFCFLENLHDYYFQLSDAHQTFDLVNTPSIKLGTVINNREQTGGQTVTHQYIVTDFEKNRFLRLVSDNSVVRGKCCCIPYSATIKTTVTFEVVQEDSETKLYAQLKLDYSNSCTRGVADMFNTTQIWSQHFQEEMDNGVAIVTSEAFAKRYAESGGKL